MEKIIVLFLTPMLTVILPFRGVYLRALDMRLDMTCLIFSLSASISPMSF